MQFMSATLSAVTGLPEAARKTADLMRRTCPDLDDAALGRVLLEIGRLAKTCTASCDLTQFAGAILLAGLDLTALEWREPPR